MNIYEVGTYTASAAVHMFSPFIAFNNGVYVVVYVVWSLWLLSSHIFHWLGHKTMPANGDDAQHKEMFACDVDDANQANEQY